MVPKPIHAILLIRNLTGFVFPAQAGIRATGTELHLWIRAFACLTSQSYRQTQKRGWPGQARPYRNVRREKA
jgi:hypothetical protein